MKKFKTFNDNTAKEVPSFIFDSFNQNMKIDNKKNKKQRLRTIMNILNHPIIIK